MIVGIGTDLIEIERVKDAVIKNARFLQRFFTEKENQIFSKKKTPYESIAGNFAVKEAVSKALGTGIRQFSLQDIEVLRDELGKPFVNLYGKAKSLSETMAVKTIHVSISHDQSHAVAFVIMEK